jgi:N-acetyl-alpha-D-muramate 1-phosphate uridylyltransferase
MQAVILAGGLGTRLWPVTKAVPKPMVPVAGEPYLAHQLRFLREQGHTDVVMLTGYLGEQIEEYFGDGGPIGMRIRYSREPAPLGTGGALRNASNLLADAFLLIYGDSFLPIRYEILERRLAETKATAVVALFEDRDGETGVVANVDVDESGFVTRYEKNAARSNLRFIDAGVLAMRAEAIQHIPAGEKSSLEEQIFPRLIERRALAAVTTEQRFYDIGTPERLRVIEGYFGDSATRRLGDSAARRLGDSAARRLGD